MNPADAAAWVRDAVTHVEAGHSGLTIAKGHSTDARLDTSRVLLNRVRDDLHELLADLDEAADQRTAA